MPIPPLACRGACRRRRCRIWRKVIVPTAEVREGIDGPCVTGPADPFVARMAERDVRERIILACRALRHDAGCIEAHLLLAAYAPNHATSLQHLQAAVRSGNEFWEPVAERYGANMAWWGFVDTQPYMRAIAALGGLHSETGNDQAARWCYERLLRMNPDDDQRIRDRLEAMGPTVGPAFR